MGVHQIWLFLAEDANDAEECQEVGPQSDRSRHGANPPNSVIRGQQIAHVAFLLVQMASDQHGVEVVSQGLVQETCLACRSADIEATDDSNYLRFDPALAVRLDRPQKP